MRQAGQREYDEGISVVEELDPERAPERGVGARRDLLLGLILLVAVVLFAGWQWWRQEYQSGQYRAGQEAAGRSDWESALHYFNEASGYIDADALAKSIQEKIDERDRLYKSARGYAAKEEWLPALRDIRAGAKIQPEYRDLKQQEESALWNVYSDALSGTVAMRDGAEPPGLYYRGASGWIWLEGSDRHSNMLARDTQGRIIYDVPSGGRTERPVPPPGSLYNTGDLFRERRLMLARASGEELEITEMSIDASYFVPVVSGEGGLWLVHPSDFIPNDHHVQPIVRDPFSIGSGKLAYQPYSGAVSSTVDIAPSTEISAGTTLVAIDPDSNRYLVAEWTNADANGTTEDTVVYLYLAAAGEASRQLVYTHTGGGLQSASISPNGRFVVVHTYSNAGNQGEQQWTALVDLQDSKRTASLITTSGPRNAATPAWMTSAFVRQGALKGSLVLSIRLWERTHIELIDPSRDPNTVNNLVAEVGVEGGQYKSWEVMSQGAEGVLVVGQDISTASPPMSSTLAMIEFSGEGEHSAHSAKVSSYSGVIAGRVLGDRILWTNYDYVGGSEPRRPLRSVYSLPRGSMYYYETPSLLFTTGNITSSYLRPDPSFYMGEKLLAYTTGDELHARTYDGTADLVLETGVAAISENSATDFYTRRMK